jgi:hypothetical protein
VDLFDFFFPDQAQAHHLRKIASKRGQSTSPPSHSAPSAEIQALRDDVNFLTLVVAALLRRLTETKTASLADIQDMIDEIDALDGIADGGLDPGVLRGLLGVLKSETEKN